MWFRNNKRSGSKDNTTKQKENCVGMLRRRGRRRTTKAYRFRPRRSKLFLDNGGGKYLRGDNDIWVERWYKTNKVRRHTMSTKNSSLLRFISWVLTFLSRPLLKLSRT